MAKLNVPARRTRPVKVTKLMGQWEGLYRVEDFLGQQVPDQLIDAPERYFVEKEPNPVTGHRWTLREYMAGRLEACFKAKWEEGDWKFLKVDKGRYW